MSHVPKKRARVATPAGDADPLPEGVKERKWDGDGLPLIVQPQAMFDDRGCIFRMGRGCFCS